MVKTNHFIEKVAYVSPCCDLCRCDARTSIMTGSDYGNPGEPGSNGEYNDLGENF